MRIATSGRRTSASRIASTAFLIRLSSTCSISTGSICTVTGLPPGSHNSWAPYFSASGSASAWARDTARSGSAFSSCGACFLTKARMLLTICPARRACCTMAWIASSTPCCCCTASGSRRDTPAA
ncbi:hypothetical protein D3C78_1528750 [compost metagenome]